MNRTWLAAALLAAVSASALAGERAAPIPPDVYAKRRAALVERLRESGAFANAGGKLTIRAGDQPEGEHDTAFRVRSDFYYLTGVDAPGAAIEIGPGRDAILLPPRDRGAERWEGPRLTAEDPRAAALGFKEVATVRAGKGEKASDDLEARIRREIAAMRLVKDEHEIARLRRACAISALANAEAGRAIEPGM